MGQFSILLLGGVMGFLLGFAHSLPHVKKIVRIHRTPSYSIKTVPDGTLVSLTGKVTSEMRSLHSPLSQTECVLWQVEVLEQQSESPWETIYDEMSAHAFEIQAGPGRVRVFPTEAELILQDDLYKKSGPLGESFEPQLQAAVEKLPISFKPPMNRTRWLKLREKVVQANETIFVLGRIKDNKGVRVISSARDGSPFWISDRSQLALLFSLYWRVVFSVLVLTTLGVLIARFVGNEIGK